MGVKTLCSDRYKEAFLLHTDERGSLFEARRICDNEKVLVEAIALSYISAEERQELLKEYTQLLTLRHDCLLSVQDIYYDAGEGHCLLIELEYFHGSMKALIHDAAGARIPFDEEYIWHLMERIVNSLTYLYTNESFSIKAHGQIWPSNILRTATNKFVLGEPILPAHFVSHLLPSEYKQAGFSYLAPETVQSKSLSECSDIWMVGCLMYELCTLTPPPFDSGTLTETPTLPSLQQLVDAGAFSHELILCIKSCLHYLPELRPSASVLRDLCARRSASALSNVCMDSAETTADVGILSIPAQDSFAANQSHYDGNADGTWMGAQQSMLLKESKVKLAMARDALLFMAIRNNDLPDVVAQKATFLRCPCKYFQRAIDDCRPEIVHQFCLWNYEHNLDIFVSARKGVSTNSKTPLMTAALEGNVAGVLESLHLSGRYCYNYLTGGETALYYAVLGCNPECVKLLLCELGIYNEKGCTASSLLQSSKGFQHDYASLLLPEQWIQPRELVEQYLLADDKTNANEFDSIHKELDSKLEALNRHLATKPQQKRNHVGCPFETIGETINRNLRDCLKSLREGRQ
ncbi:Kinase, NEK [Giardia duodenalis]|uniref:non-specific serine/threonine protein kinase n=1 Tax=Giardia intestinalis (strain ATCC 50803 / WB clone C6) TaxID=184922 RepID=A8BFQ4_GIAIC|nr:Kinase, NEK [Giardia intestinalis]KAE8303396.1 Kinase, NEK [Giardia intestinalis]|eukprot:XP_001707317.1 Kinase, NEK-frag [Giardia lamblia ATCC 50803]